MTDKDAKILRRLFEDMQESNEHDDPAEWTLSGDDYYDFLEGWKIGHRRIREWVSEKRAGETVRLTQKGIDLFRSFIAAPQSSSFGTQGE